MVGREGVEPSTSRLSGVRSNHLSYRPNLVRPSRMRDWRFKWVSQGPGRRRVGGSAGEAASGACRAKGARTKVR